MIIDCGHVLQSPTATRFLQGSNRMARKRCPVSSERLENNLLGVRGIQFFGYARTEIASEDLPSVRTLFSARFSPWSSSRHLQS